ncbi:MAG: class II aldolase/adducin family protein [Candidatus Cloacimonetes bacterium]|nr:class II aldolase/adducin family protein [Candidatus Cloacimonadota bacterium]
MKPVEVIEEIKEIAAFCMFKGWAEKNAGNLSYRLEEKMLFNWLVSNKEFKIKKSLEMDNFILDENFTILISNSGVKFRDIVEDPLAHFSAVYLQNGVLNIHCSDEFSSPSSEFRTHLLIHQYLLKEQSPNNTIIHTHPTHLIAFSHKHYLHSKNKLNRILESTIPEIEKYIPKKTGFVDLYPAGSDALAEESLKEIQNHEVVVWKKHGCIAIGDNFWNTIDKIDLLDKAAQIALLAGIE